MRSFLMFGTALTLCSLAAYGCKGDDDDDNGTPSGGKSGATAAGASSKAGKASGGASGAGGKASGKGGSGTGGSSGEGGGDGASGPGSEGGQNAGNNGGSSGTNAQHNGGASNESEAGAAQGGGSSSEPEKRENLAAPDREQTPVDIGPSFVVDSTVTKGIAVAGTAGDVFVMTRPELAAPVLGKFSSGELKWTHTMYAAVTTIAASGDGGVYFSGTTTAPLPGETEGGTRDAIIGKLDEDGNQEWAHQWGSPGIQYGKLLGLGPDNSALLSGTCNDQAPGASADAKGGFYLARYESDGTRTFLDQYNPTGLGGDPLDLFVDPSGNSFISEAYGLAKINADGDFLSAPKIVDLGVAPPGRSLSSNVQYNFGAWAPDHKAIYEVSQKTGLPNPTGLFKIRLDGSVEWYRLAVESTATVADDGTTWAGNFQRMIGIWVTHDSIYLAGIYTNTYTPPSRIPYGTEPMYLGRYDLDGNPIWIQELEGTDDNRVYDILLVAEDGDGNPVATLAGDGLNSVTLKKSDGSVK